jgi:hypothetical protein
MGSNMADVNSSAFIDALRKRYSSQQQPAMAGPETPGALPPDYNPLRASAVAKDAEAAWRQSQANMENSRSLIDRAAGTAQAALAGVEQGVVGTAGLPADLSNMLRVYGPAAYSVLSHTGDLFTKSHDPVGDIGRYWTEAADTARAGLSPDEQAGKSGNVFGLNLPTGETVVQGARDMGIPFINYKPRNDWERGVMDVGKYTGYGLAGIPLGGGAGLIGGGLRGAALEGAMAGARAGAGEILPMTAAGLTHQAGKATTNALGIKGVPAAVIETMSDIPGYMMGKVLTKGPDASRIATEKLAHPVVSSQITDPGRARNAIDAALAQDYYPTLQPRATDVIPELRGIRGEVENFANLKNNPLQNVGVQARNEASERADALSNMARDLSGQIEGAIPAFPEPAPVRDTIDSARTAAEKFQQRVQAIEGQEKALWANPAMQLAEYDAYPAMQAFNNVDASIRDTLQDVEAFMNNRLSNGTLSGQDLKLVRSDIGAKLGAAPSGSIAQSEYKKLYDALSNNLFDSTNLTPQSMHNINASGAADAYRDAVAATREKHVVFGDPQTVLGKLATRDNSGAFRSPQDFMDTIMKGDVNSNLRALRQAGVDVSDDIRDYVLGSLVDQSKGSVMRVDEGKLARFMSDDRNRILIQNTPGLEDQLNAMRGLTVKDRMTTDLSNTMDKLASKPQEFSRFLEKNRADLDNYFQSPEQQGMLDAMQNSADLFKDLKSGSMKPNDPRFLQALKDKPIFSMLYGRVAALPFNVLAEAVNLLPAAWNIATLKMAPAWDLLSHPQRTLDRLYSMSREDAGRALLEILNDPIKADALIGAPTPAKTNALMEYLNDFASAGAKVGAMGYIGQQQYAPEKPQKPDFYDQARRAAWEQYYQQNPDQRPPEGSYFKGGRIARKSGGRIMSAGSAAEELIAAAEKAKKGHSETTSPLLDVPDEAITKALAIANEKI